MTEDKTLKDIVMEWEDKELIDKVKRETIKWIKKDINDYTKEDSIVTPIYLIKRWMRRMDITEEDLNPTYKLTDKDLSNIEKVRNGIDLTEEDLK